jgi:actin related protein 2/3 complex subunit 2
MILLEPGNRILGETVAAQINGGADTKREPIDVRLCDFDDASYRIIIDSKTKNLLQVTLNLPCYSTIKDHGAEEAAKAAFGDRIISSTEGDLTVQVDLDKEEKKEEIIKKLTLFKPIVLGGVFRHYYTKLAKGEAPAAPFKFDLRKDTQVYIIPDKDRVVTVFGLDFTEKVDKACARIFMQEFADARKTLNFAPPVQWSVPPPSELKAFGLKDPTGNLGFFSLAILKDHVVKEDVITKVVDALQSFRTYLQYHIKCSKSYFHSRMRAKAKDLLKVLNRAKQIDPEASTNRKTITGKTFTRAT